VIDKLLLCGFPSARFFTYERNCTIMKVGDRIL